MIIKYKLNIFSGPDVVARQNVNELFKNVTDTLNLLTASNTVTRIAFNTGSNAGGGNGQGFHNEFNHWGNNGWACYRFNSTETRSWDWYLLVQFASASGNFGDAPGNPGLANGTNESQSGNEGTMAIAAAAMVNSAGSSVNPWNGTTNNDGNDSKGDPVWVTGSTGDRLFVLPRSNSDDGNHATSRENMARNYNNTSTANDLFYHIIASEDGLVIASDFSINNGWAVNFIGNYEPIPSVSSSIPTPLWMFVTDLDASNLPAPADVIGTRAGNGTIEGGIATGNGTVRASVDAYTNVLFSFSGFSQPNRNLSSQATIDEYAFPVMAFDVESGVYGALGFINNPLLRQVFNVMGSSLSIDRTRQALLESGGARTGVGYTIPWHPSASLPKGFKGRRGEDF